MQLISRDSLDFRGQLHTLKQVSGICLCGLFAAAYVVLSFFSIRLSAYLEFRFAFLALAAAAACGGPVMGMTAGIAGDIVSALVTPQSGAFFPGFTLSYAILGFAFGLILYRVRITPLRSFAAAFSDFALSATLDTLWLKFICGMDFKYLFTLRLPKNLISLGINAVILFVFMRAFARILTLNILPSAARKDAGSESGGRTLQGP